MSDQALAPRHLALALMVALVWGFNFVASAVVLRHLEPFLFTALRFAIVLAVLAPFLRPVRQWGRLVVVALSCGALHFVTYFIALREAGELSMVAIVMQTYVPAAALISMVWLGERVGWRRALAIGIAFAGVVVVGFDPQAQFGLAPFLWSLLSALLLGFGTTAMRGLKDVGPFQLQAWMALISLPVLLLGTALTESGQWAALVAAPGEAWGGALYSALGSSIIGHGALYYLITRYPVAVVTPWVLLAPIIAVWFGVWIWGDQLTVSLVIGGSMVLGGVLVVQVRGRRREPLIVAAPRTDS